MFYLHTEILEKAYGAIYMALQEEGSSFIFDRYAVMLAFGIDAVRIENGRRLTVDTDVDPYDFCVFKEHFLAFSNPHVVTISGTAHNLKRISESAGVAVFQKIAASLEITLTLRHTRESKKADGSQIIRHNIELVMTTWDVNLKPEVTQVYAVSRSRVGADPTVVTAVLDALGVQLDAQSASLVDSDVGP